MSDQVKTTDLKVRPDKIIKTVALVVVCGFIFGYFGYLYGENNAETTATNITSSATPTPTITSSKTATAVASISAMGTETIPAGWVKKTIPELGVSFNYPETLGDFNYKIIKATDEGGAGSSIIASIGGSKDEPYVHATVDFLSQSKDYRTSLGRGSGFLDFDGYEKVGGTFNIFQYEWEGGKGPASDAANQYSDPREVAAKNLTALVVNGRDNQSPGDLGTDYIGMILPLGNNTYHAIAASADTKKISQEDFIKMVKSFSSTK